MRDILDVIDNSDQDEMNGEIDSPVQHSDVIDEPVEETPNEFDTVNQLETDDQALSNASELGSIRDEISVFLDDELEEAAPAGTENMAPATDSQGHRSYKDSSASSFAAKQGFTG